jgi:hypothetical protein
MQLKNKLTIGSLEFKITDDKLYIDTISGSETYALRSINGISVKDDIDEYNVELNKHKEVDDFNNRVAGGAVVIGAIGIIALFNGLITGEEGGISGGTIFIGGAIIYYKKVMKKTMPPPQMRSVVRITMNSGDKSFSFFKDDANSGAVADFVATLEDTLTAFHK